MRLLYIAHRREDRLRASRETLFPLREHSLHFLALRIVLRPAELARDDRKIACPRVTFDLRFGHVRKGPDHDVFAVVRQQFGRHGLEPPTEEEIEEQSLHDVVPVMAERDLA